MHKVFAHKNYILKATCLFWLIGKIVSYKLWLSDRLFPIVPPFDFLLSVPNSVHLILFLTSLLLLCTSIVKTNKSVIIILVVIELLSCLLDQNRWQPWQYQYLITLVIIVINFNNIEKINTWLNIILAATYFYTGFQKLNMGFLTIVWQKALLHQFFHIPTYITHLKIVLYTGLIIPFLEIGLGIGLLVKKIRKYALCFVVFVHLFILAAIGPWALYVNIIVWPWNMLMLLYALYFLLSRNYKTHNYAFLINKQNIAVTMVWCVFPLLNYIGMWDYFMSFSLYSGRIPNMEICVQKNLPKELDYYFHIKPKPLKCNCENGVNIQVWGMDEILVPPLPQERVYEKVKLALDKKYPTMQAEYYIYYLPKSEEHYRKIK